MSQALMVGGYIALVMVLFVCRFMWSVKRIHRGGDSQNTHYDVISSIFNLVLISIAASILLIHALIRS